MNGQKGRILEKMKVVVGIDIAGHWKAPVNLLRRLRFTDVSATLVHVIEPIPMVAIHPMAADPNALASVELELEKCGQNALAEAHHALGMHCEEVERTGSAATELIAEAQKRGADLIAIGGQEQGAWSSFFFGSTEKDVLADAEQSILFGKDTAKSDGPVRAIFATDHSDFASRAADWLLEHLPTGIEQIIVFTAVEEGQDTTQATQANHDLALNFSRHGMAAHGEARAGDPNALIEELMASHQADLLIVGAQGHGFLERLRIGSFSYSQVIHSPHSVLVVRP